MLRVFLSLWVMFTLSGSALAQEKQASPHLDPQTGISLPASLGSLKRAGVKKYDQPELGIGYRYEAAPLIKGDIFIYNLGLKNLGTGLNSRDVRPQFDQAKNDISALEKMGRYRGVNKVSEGEIPLGSPPLKIPTLSAVFTYSQAPEPGVVVYAGVRVSHLLLTAYKDYFIKIRFTYPEKDKSQGEKALQQFLADFGKTLK